MPYKFNESRRHQIPKARYRVTNWPEYDAALVKRGSLTVWITEEAVAAWHAPATGERGGAGGGFGDSHRDGARAAPCIPSATSSDRRHAALDCRRARG